MVAGIALFAALVLILRPGQAKESGPLLQYPPEQPAPTIGPNPTLPAGLASGPLFVADFTTAESLSDWQLVELDFTMPGENANWVIDNGRLRQDFTGELRSSLLHEVAALAPGVYSNGVVRVSFYDEANGVVGLIAHYQGEPGYESSYYRLRLLKNEYEATPKYRLDKVVEGVVFELGTVEGPGFVPQQWNVIELEFRNGTLLARLNGKLLMHATDTEPLPAGKVGVYTLAIGGIFFDDFIVGQ